MLPVCRVLCANKVQMTRASAAVVTVPGRRLNHTPILGSIPKFPTRLDVRQSGGAGSPIITKFRFMEPEEVVPAGGRRIRFFKTQVMNIVADDVDQWPALEMASASVRGLELPIDPSVVAIFYKGLFQLAMAKLRRKFPIEADAPPHVVVTYPSTWDNAELRELKLAISQAGIQDFVCGKCEGIRYCSEQEAALQCIMHDHKEQLLPLSNVSLHIHPVPSFRSPLNYWTILCVMWKY
jgi:hypothetical protein